MSDFGDETIGLNLKDGGRPVVHVTHRATVTEDLMLERTMT